MAGASRKYPERPIVGVGAVIPIDGCVVLVKRKFEPSAGSWTLPGGAIEIGETAREALAREILEETGLVVEVGDVIDVIDRVTRDDDGRVAYHFVVVDYVCRAVSGELRAGSDVEDVALVPPARLPEYRVTEAVARVVAQGMEMALPRVDLRR